MPVRRLRMRGIRQLPAAEKTEQDWRFFAAARGLYPLYQDAEKAAKIEQINTGELSFGSYMKDGFILLKDLIDKGYINPEKALVTEAAKDDIAEFVKEDTAFMPGGFLVCFIHQ